MAENHADDLKNKKEPYRAVIARKEIAWKLLQELLEAIPGEKELSTVEAIIDEMKSIAYYNAAVKIEG